MTPWNPGHIVERYGLFTIIVLGECVLATTTAVQTALNAGGLLGPLLTVAAGGLLLVFGLWWSYFKHEPEIGHHLSLRSMLAWGYGHYFVFAAVAALGAGLQVTTETTHDAADMAPSVAAATVAVPVVIYLLAVGFLHARPRTPRVLAPIVVAAALILVTPLVATWIGVPPTVFAMGLLVGGLVAVIVAAMQREIA